MFKPKYALPVSVFVFVFLILSVVQLKVNNPMLLLERFYDGGGWIEIVFISFYGAFVTYKMQEPCNVPRWRRITWTLFSVVFFSQLLLGISGLDKFLMTGTLHLPIPMMIISGPIYRAELSFMTILFLSTIILSGPAWCSQYCYFGALDNIAASGKSKKNKIKSGMAIKATIVFIVILATLLLRWLNVPMLTATITAAVFGITGILIILLVSTNKGKMYHCILYCPVGSLVNLFRYANPFRMYIDSSCTLCMRCSTYCKFDALNPEDIKNKKPGFTCTYCGDCLAACNDNSIKYKYFNLSPELSRNLYLFLTISLHASFLALARI